MTHDRTSDAAAEYERIRVLADRRREINAAQTRARAARKRFERELAATLIARGVPAGRAGIVAAEEAFRDEHNRYVAEVEADLLLRGTVTDLLWTR
jgi:hypothetical protein